MKVPFVLLSHIVRSLADNRAGGKPKTKLSILLGALKATGHGIAASAAFLRVFAAMVAKLVCARGRERGARSWWKWR